MVGFSELFTGYEMELETHVQVQILNQLGFHELQLHAITWVENAPPPSCFHGPMCLDITKKTHVATLRKHYVSRDHKLYYSCTKI